jgi:hypothetical protein
MVLAYLVAEVARRGGRPPDKHTVMAFMGVVLAAQIGYTVSREVSKSQREGESARRTKAGEATNDGDGDGDGGVGNGNDAGAGAGEDGGRRGGLNLGLSTSMDVRQLTRGNERQAADLDRTTERWGFSRFASGLLLPALPGEHHGLALFTTLFCKVKSP